jgi:hypothetical protein
LEKLTACASCGTALEERSGPGRRATYCGEPCRRMAEFQIRGLVRRIDRAEIEVRELTEKVRDREDYDRIHWLRRLRVVRRWLADDQAKLRALLGAPETGDDE